MIIYDYCLLLEYLSPLLIKLFLPLTSNFLTQIMVHIMITTTTITISSSLTVKDRSVAMMMAMMAMMTLVMNNIITT